MVGSELTRADRMGGLRVRWGIGRYDYTVDPGLYALGTPSPRSPVLVSANYKLSFDVLRSAIPGRDAWILVLDTRGINVWCAAGKGTFGTDELAARIESSQLASVVVHGVVVVPQLGAVGVSAPEIRRRTRLRVVYGPVRAADLGAFLDAGLRTTPEMRRVRFTLRDRLVLVPVEAVGMLALALAIAVGATLLGGIGGGWFSLARLVQRAPLAFGASFGALAAGTILTPLLLPWLPGRMFSLKGAIAGAFVALVLVAKLALLALPASVLSLLAASLFLVAGASFAAMNFTGSSTFTSLHGVEREMSVSMPWQIAGAAIAAVLWIAGGFIR